MPVVLEHLKSPISTQDAQEVSLILSEISEPWCGQLPVPFMPSAEVFLSTLDTQRLYGGRFNGHLLGLLVTTPINHGWLIAGVCVRPLTRRRTIASQMLARLCQFADKMNWWLHIDLGALDKLSYGKDLVVAKGFHYREGILIRQPGE